MLRSWDTGRLQVGFGPFQAIASIPAKNLMKERIDQLILPQSAQLLLAESPSVQESPKQLREPRIATVILAVDPFTAFDHVIFQIPQIRQLLNRVGHLLCFLNHSVKLPTQSSVEGCLGNGLF